MGGFYPLPAFWRPQSTKLVWTWLFLVSGYGLGVYHTPPTSLGRGQGCVLPTDKTLPFATMTFYLCHVANGMEWPRCCRMHLLLGHLLPNHHQLAWSLFGLSTSLEFYWKDTNNLLYFTIYCGRMTPVLYWMIFPFLWFVDAVF